MKVKKKSARQRALDSRESMGRLREQPVSRELVAKAHTHQGDPTLYGSAAGRQCMCNVLYFALMAKHRAVSSWTTEVLDEVLFAGAQKYMQMDTTNYLAVDELPEILKWQGHTYNRIAEEANCYRGSLDRKQTDTDVCQFSLSDALHQAAMFQECTFVTVGNKAPSYTMGFLEQNTKYYWFDSHARDEQGLCKENGHAVVLVFLSISHIEGHIRQLCTSVGYGKKVAFEVAVVSLTDRLKGPVHGQMHQYMQDQTVREIQKKYEDRENSCSAGVQNKKVSGSVKMVAKERMQRYRLAMSNEKYKVALQKQQAGMLRKRLSLSEEDLRRVTQKETASKIEKRRRMSEEDRRKVAEKQKAGMKRKRRSLSEEDQRRITQKETASRITARRSMSEEDKRKVTKMQQAAKKKSRERLTENDRRRTTEKQKAGMKRRRLNLSAQDKKRIAEKETASKIQKRKSVSKDHKKKVSEKQRAGMKRKRLSLSTEDQERAAVKERIGKIKKRHPITVDGAIALFFEHKTASPEYICTCCHRQMYSESVSRFVREKYNVSDAFIQQCTTGIKSADSREWICQTCSNHFKKQRKPAQGVHNKMEVSDVPDEMKDLTNLEARLLAKRYPFMKIVSLPKGKQPGIRGGVVNVPIVAENVCKSLPRTPSNAGIIPVKLKKKLSYKGYVSYKFIRPNSVKRALRKLKTINQFYTHVEENEQWEDQCNAEGEDTWKRLVGTVDAEEGQGDVPDEELQVGTEGSRDEEQPLRTADENDQVEETDDAEDEQDHGQVDDDDTDNEDPLAQHRGIKYDSCIQPNDPALETEGVFSIAPGEGKRPISLMTDEHCEEQSFPLLFPTGKFGFNVKRDVKLSPKKYFIARMLNKDPRFAQNVEYLFFAQYITEHKQVMDNISVALRKARMHTGEGERVTAGMLNDDNLLKRIIFKDKAYRILQTVRGSPPYWQGVMYKLLAAVKQLGLFTWFLTLSAADLRWNDTLQAIARQQGKNLSEEDIAEMSWDEKCTLLASNPVTAARHFDHRLQCLMRDIVLSEVKPLGKIRHYMYRIEFQQRGSPHAHCVLWVEDAPSHDDSEELIRNFTDKHVTCVIPTEDEEPRLHNLVCELQRHNHSATCRKSGKKCRFNYPRPIAHCTVVADKPDSDDPVQDKKLVETAAEVLSKVREVLEDEEGVETWTTQEVLDKAGIPEEQYLQAARVNSRGKSIVYQRTPEEVNINTYNPVILKAWEANMDVQFVSNPYACIHYIISYVTKDEREMGVALREVSKNMGDLDIRQQMKQVASCFLNAREVSAQEAVYRILGLPLYRSTFETVFIPTDLPQNRVVLLKPASILQKMEEEDEDVCAQTMADRYAHRPEIIEALTLAEFAKWYVAAHGSRADDEANEAKEFQPDILAQETNKTNKIKLLDGRGYVRKRRKPCVIRYHKFNEAQEEERYSHHMLMLFHSWRKEKEDLMNGHASYSEYFNVCREDILAKQAEIEHYTDIVDSAMENEESHGAPVHAWDTLDTEGQHEDALAEDEGAEVHPEHSVLEPGAEHIADPDLPRPSRTSTQRPQLAIESRPGVMAEDLYQAKVRSLNTEQRQVYDHIHSWCNQVRKSRKAGAKPDAVHLFVTGGAGTGKSHLISTIYQMGVRTLPVEGGDPEAVKVLLTAPTGTAAFNIKGCTLHSAFLLPTDKTQSSKNKQSEPYHKLSDEKRNTLRLKLNEMELLIIDEISMVGPDMLWTIDQRLREIKGVRKLFGGVSVIALGDLYQLAPVKQKLIFEPVSGAFERLSETGYLWQDTFVIMELTAIMRQRDDRSFAELLNRIRVGEHTNEDVSVLTQCILSPDDAKYPRNALHVFGTNDKVNEHNARMLSELPTTVRKLTAVDKYPSIMKNWKPSGDQRDTGGLPEALYLSVGARVMLIKNIDVCDGLVNGALGKVVGFIENNPPSHLPRAVLVVFESESSGEAARLSSHFDLANYPEAVPITPVEAKYSISGKKAGMEIRRHQFPLRLCWATTIHKVQGLTIDQIVVSMEGNMKAGQVYVALSRATSLSGLCLLDLNAKKIRASFKVKMEYERMRKDKPLKTFHTQIIEAANMITKPFLVAVHNTRSLPAHHRDLLLQPLLRNVDVICLTETWLTQAHGTGPLAIPGFTLMLPARLAGTRGVCNYVRDSLIFSSFCPKAAIPSSDTEVQTTEVKSLEGLEVCIVTVYRHPSSPLPQFRKTFTCLIQDLSRKTVPVVIVGDFNIDLLKGPHSAGVQQALDQGGFRQYVTSATHKSGSLLDHVYSNRPVQVWQGAAYYSDHDVLWLALDITSSL